MQKLLLLLYSSSGTTSNIFITHAMQFVALHTQVNTVMAYKVLKEEYFIYFDALHADEKTPNHWFGCTVS